MNTTAGGGNIINLTLNSSPSSSIRRSGGGGGKRRRTDSGSSSNNNAARPPAAARRRLTSAKGPAAAAAEVINLRGGSSNNNVPLARRVGRMNNNNTDNNVPLAQRVAAAAAAEEKRKGKRPVNYNTTSSNTATTGRTTGRTGNTATTATSGGVAGPSRPRRRRPQRRSPSATTTGGSRGSFVNNNNNDKVFVVNGGGGGGARPGWMSDKYEYPAMFIEGRGKKPKKPVYSSSNSNNVAIRPFAGRDVFPPLNRKTPSPPRNANWRPRTRFGDLELQPHQVVVSRVFSQSASRVPGLLLFFRVGSGKTLAAIAAVENLALRENRPDRRVLVVTPASLRENFAKELARAQVPNPGRYTIMSYEGLHRMTSNARKALAKGSVLVVDEVQARINPLGRILNSLLQASRKAHKRLLLTGTPVMNYPADVGSYLGIINPNNVIRTVKVRRPRKDGQRYDQNTGQALYVEEPTFKKNFGRLAQKNKEELDAMFQCTVLYYEPDPEMIRRHYPVATQHIVEVEMTVKQTRKQYALANTDASRASLNEAALLEQDEVPAFLTKVREVNSSYDGDSPKIDELVRRVLIAVGRNGGPVVVFSSFLIHGLDIVAAKLRAALGGPGLAMDMFTGKATPAEKKAIVERYNAGGTRVLLLSDAGSEGLDLKNTSEVHILEPAWNQEKIQQVIGRAVRYKSHEGSRSKEVKVYRYVSLLNPRAPKPPHSDNKGLYKYTADQILVQISDLKHRDNTEFVRRLVAISDQNQVQCVE